MRFLLSLIMMLAMLWSAMLLWFVSSMPMQPTPPTIKSEALVVLTGGAGRIEHGLDMLGEDAAPLMFISGVGERVTVGQILKEHADAQTRQAIAESDGQIILDHVARTTVSNAGQSVEFLHERGIHRIRLVTANYHMKRAIREFHDADPTLSIIPDPVFPDEFERDGWWHHDNARRLIFSEFYKYLAVLLRDALRPGK